MLEALEILEFKTFFNDQNKKKSKSISNKHRVSRNKLKTSEKKNVEKRKSVIYDHKIFEGNFFFCLHYNNIGTTGESSRAHGKGGENTELHKAIGELYKADAAQARQQQQQSLATFDIKQLPSSTLLIPITSSATAIASASHDDDNSNFVSIYLLSLSLSLSLCVFGFPHL